jgi:hypothetical protein
MREIPSLQILCLRNVGGKACNAEDTFAATFSTTGSSRSGNDDSEDETSNNKKELSAASKLLRSGLLTTRTPAIGYGSARRKQANDVDLHHPWVAVRLIANNANDSDDNDTGGALYSEYNTAALDVLQAYVDSLVELSRMDDNRLGLHFFQEWKALVQAKQQQRHQGESAENTSNKRRKITTPPLGSLSLYNTIIQQETIGAMVESKMTYNLAVLDMTGVQTLTDELLQPILTHAPYLRRLSIKNCRRLTRPTLECLSDHCPQLTSLDIGGAYNFHVNDVLEMVASLSQLVELHASGLLWKDAQLQDLCHLRSWRALSLGFLLPVHVSADGLKQALISQSKCLSSLALPFCEHLVDAALMGVLGRHLPHVETLDVRGNSALNSLTGWYDGRATIQQQSDTVRFGTIF